MSKVAWVASTEGEVALTANTARTVLNVIAPANKIVTVVAWKVDFDGTTAGAEPVLVELMRSTQTTTGTSTAVTPRRKRGQATTVGATAAKSYTPSNEPGALTLIEDYALDPYKGLFAIEYPLGREAESGIAEGMLLRLNAPATVNVRAFIEFEEG